MFKLCCCSSLANSTYLLDVNCRCTMLQKTHDFTSPNGLLFRLPVRNRTDSLNYFHRQGILLIRNPFQAIISYRNYASGGFKAIAPKQLFMGRGKRMT